MFDRFWEQQSEADAVLVSSEYNMRYLSGFRGGEGYIFLRPERRVILVDSRYTTQAREESHGFEVMEVRADFGEAIAALARETGTKRLMFEDCHLTYSAWSAISGKCPEVQWIPAKDALDRLRVIKTEAELARIAKAEAIGDMAFARILDDIKPGVTELEVAAKLEYYMREAGTAKNSFDTIVASGVHSSMPHAIPTEKKIEKGDFVTMDFGCIYDGYCSDMTRTVVVGKADTRQREIYDTVLRAQLAALEAIKPGMKCSEADMAARSVIEAAGYGEYFGHALGHSVGLQIHEKPALSARCHEILQPDMIETVEPGIYIPGFGGVRIEDLVRITDDGCENFTHSPKELIEL